MLSESDVNWLNDKILSTIVKPVLGNVSTYMNTLHKLCKDFFGVKFAGVKTSDMIPLLSDISPFCILNLDNSSMSGSHWIAVVKFLKKDKYLVYDSFGRKSKVIIPSIHNKFGSEHIVDTDYDAEQQIEEYNCGQRCVAFLLLTDMFGVENSIKL